MQKAVIYARYSSGAQRNVSIDQQVKACRSFAEHQGIEISDIYEDRALTGTNDKRPGFQKMISDSAKQEWAYVIVYTLDRFARDRYDSAIYKRKLKDNGIRVLSAMEHLTDDPTGILMESVLEGFAEYYSRELAQKTRRGMIDNAEKCLVNGPLPVCFERGSDGRYAIYEPEAIIFREACNRVLNGETVATIARDLQQRGLRTRKGKLWTREILYHALGNERYAGVYIYGDIRIDGGVPAVVSRETFDAIQHVLATKPNPRRPQNEPTRRRTENGMYLLTGKLYCGSCGSPMVGVSGRGKCGVVYYYYACKNQKLHQCTAAPVRRDQIEWDVANAIREYVLNEEGIAAITDAVMERQKQSEVQMELQGLKDQLSDAQRSIRNIMGAIEQGVFAPSVQKRLIELEAQEQQLRARAAVLEAQSAHLPTRDDIMALLAMYQNGDPDNKDYQQALIDTFLRAAYVYDDHLDLVFTIGDKGKTVTIPSAHELADILSDTVKSSYKGYGGSPLLHIRTLRAEIIMFYDVFAVRCPVVRTKKAHTV